MPHRALRCYSAVEPPEVLRDEIAANQLLVGVDEPLGDRPRHSGWGGGSAVQAAHPANAEAGRRQKALVCGVGVVEIDVGFFEWNTELAGQVDDRLAAHPGEDVALPRGQQLAVANQEDVAALPFGEIAVDV